MKQRLDPIWMGLQGCILFPILVGIMLFFRLLNWFNPQIIRLTEKGEGSLTIDLPRWFLFENAMTAEVRLCAGNGRGKVPKKLCNRGTLLRPGQKLKIYFPVESFYEIEVYGRDGQRLEQMKLRVSIDFYAD